jgi:hypothetical protein
MFKKLFGWKTASSGDIATRRHAVDPEMRYCPDRGGGVRVKNGIGTAEIMVDKPRGLLVIPLKNPQGLPGIRCPDLQPEIRAASPFACACGFSGKQRRDPFLGQQYPKRFEVPQFALTNGNTLIQGGDIH